MFKIVLYRNSMTWYGVPTRDLVYAKEFPTIEAAANGIFGRYLGYYKTWGYRGGDFHGLYLSTYKRSAEKAWSYRLYDEDGYEISLVPFYMAAIEIKKEGQKYTRPFSGFHYSRYCFHRRPRTQAELVASGSLDADQEDAIELGINPAKIKLRARRNNIPTAYDDINRNIEKNWKRHRKTRYRVINS